MDAGFRERLVAALEASGVAAEVVVTRNRSTMVSVRAKRTLRGARELDREVRVSDRLAALGDSAIEPIVAFALDRPDAQARIQALIALVPEDASRTARLPNAGQPASLRLRSRAPVRSRGLHHDLAELGEAERRVHLPELAPLPVAWGRGAPHKRLRSIRLGSYEPDEPIIRIHPRLDDPRVPAWFIGFVIFHEYLHHVHGLHMSPRGDRRELHPPAFREDEARHPRYADALAWEEAHITEILSEEW